MRSVVQILLVLAIGGTGCKRPPEAPQELDDLSRYLYREWDNEDEAVVAVGLDNLKAFLRDVDLTKPVLDRSWELEPVKPRDVDDVDHPKRDPARTLGVAVAYRSTWPIDDHARLQIEPDQLIAEPSAALYDRRFPGVSDPDCFLSQDCNPMSTENDV